MSVEIQLKYYFLPQMKHLIQQSALKSEKLKMISVSLPLLFPNFSKIGGGFWEIGFFFSLSYVHQCQYRGQIL